MEGCSGLIENLYRKKIFNEFTACSSKLNEEQQRELFHNLYRATRTRLEETHRHYNAQAKKTKITYLNNVIGAFNKLKDPLKPINIKRGIQQMSEILHRIPSGAKYNNNTQVGVYSVSDYVNNPGSNLRLPIKRVELLDENEEAALQAQNIENAKPQPHVNERIYQEEIDPSIYANLGVSSLASSQASDPANSQGTHIENVNTTTTISRGPLNQPIQPGKLNNLQPGHQVQGFNQGMPNRGAELGPGRNRLPNRRVQGAPGNSIISSPALGNTTGGPQRRNTRNAKKHNNRNRLKNTPVLPFQSQPVAPLGQHIQQGPLNNLKPGHQIQEFNQATINRRSAIGIRSGTPIGDRLPYIPSGSSIISSSPLGNTRRGPQRRPNKNRTANLRIGRPQNNPRISQPVAPLQSPMQQVPLNNLQLGHQVQEFSKGGPNRGTELGTGRNRLPNRKVQAGPGNSRIPEFNLGNTRRGPQRRPNRNRTANLRIGTPQNTKKKRKGGPSLLHLGLGALALGANRLLRKPTNTSSQLARIPGYTYANMSARDSRLNFIGADGKIHIPHETGVVEYNSSGTVPTWVVSGNKLPVYTEYSSALVPPTGPVVNYGVGPEWGSRNDPTLGRKHLANINNGSKQPRLVNNAMPALGTVEEVAAKGTPVNGTPGLVQFEDGTYELNGKPGRFDTTGQWWFDDQEIPVKKGMFNLRHIPKFK